MNQLAAASYADALGRCFVRFHLWHDCAASSCREVGGLPNRESNTTVRHSLRKPAAARAAFSYAHDRKRVIVSQPSEYAVNEL